MKTTLVNEFQGCEAGNAEPDSFVQRALFAYDGVGNRTVVSDGKNLDTYTYDKKSRLTNDLATGTSPHNYTYTYDPIDNRLTSTETGALANWMYDASSRITTSIEGSAVSTYTYDSNGNTTVIQTGNSFVTMSYDKENKLVVHQDGAVITTYTYGYDLLKRSERSGATIQTLVWDNGDLLQVRS